MGRIRDYTQTTKRLRRGLEPQELLPQGGHRERKFQNYTINAPLHNACRLPQKTNQSSPESVRVRSTKDSEIIWPAFTPGVRCGQDGTLSDSPTIPPCDSPSQIRLSDKTCSILEESESDCRD